MLEMLEEYRQRAKDYFSEPEYIVVSQWFDEITELAVSKERERAVEIIKDFKFYDWSGEQEIYEQMEEIITAINTK